MENNKCENCRHWSVTNPPSIGKCNKRDATTIFNDVCSKYEPNEVESIRDSLHSIFGDMRVPR